MGKSRAAAHALGVYDEGARLHSYSESVDSIDTSDLESSQSEGAPPPLFLCIIIHSLQKLSTVYQ